MDNSICYDASELLRRLDPNCLTSRRDLEMTAQRLISALGMPCSATGLDNGTLALVLMCGLLREHGGSIKALSEAHQQLHAPSDGSLPPKRAW